MIDQRRRNNLQKLASGKLAGFNTTSPKGKALVNFYFYRVSEGINNLL
jgi:hypothetical protein